MEYVEFLRDRRILRNYAFVLLAGLILGAISLVTGTHGVIEVRDVTHQNTVQVSAVLVACAFQTLIIASCVAPGLSAQGATLAIAWTRPVTRAGVAWRLISVDLAAVVVAYVMLLAAGALFYLVFGTLVTFHVVGNGVASLGATTSLGGIIKLSYDVPDMVGEFVRGFGCILMWYALVTLATARLPGRGAMIAGLSWVAFLALGSFWAIGFPPLIHTIIVALNYLNPLAYFTSIGSDPRHQVLALNGTVRTLLPWCIGIAALLGTVRLWSTQEV